MTIRQRYIDVHQHVVNLSANRSNELDPVRLLVVSKAQSIEDVKQIVECGQTHFGENYLQEAIEKINALVDYDLVWHFIGRIQSNKTALIAKNFSWVHGLTTIEHAVKLDQARQGLVKPLNVCIQVRLDSLGKKAGVEPEKLLNLVSDISAFANLKVRGLMAMCEQQDSSLQRKQKYLSLSALKDEIVRAGIGLDTLSMGMSDDYDVAIDAGATIVRVGSAIFGARS